MPWKGWLVWLGVPLLAVAQPGPAFTLVQAQVRAGEPVAVRIEDTGACYSTRGVSRHGSRVTLHLDYLDYVPCDAGTTSPRTQSIGTFAPGRYDVVIEVCSNVPPPEGPCFTHTTLALAVQGVSDSPHAVPASSAITLLLAALAIVAAARVGLATSTGAH